ncbi:hypothetical protein GW17_00029315 [Ensete ventricosum]|nr:hypothetical protein GW17_00029315 [Ensete ventricosum]
MLLTTYAWMPPKCGLCPQVVIVAYLQPATLARLRCVAIACARSSLYSDTITTGLLFAQPSLCSGATVAGLLFTRSRCAQLLPTCGRH